MELIKDWVRILIEAWPMLGDGFKMTIGITVLSLVLAIIIGILSCLCRISTVAPLRWISSFYIWLIRGTPMLVQAFYIYFAIPQLIQLINPDFRIQVFTAGLIALTLNAGAYMTEIFRGAIDAVNKGQMEAARSLGLSYSKSMVKVILPQAVRICLPSLVNQCIITLKDSTLLYAIGLAEIMYSAKIYVGRTMESLAIYTWVALFFLVTVSILMILSSRLERRLKG